MTQKIEVDVNVKDNGSLDKLIKKTNEANNSLTKMQMAAQGHTEGTNYRQAKGIAGATGAGARDFSRQAQGLGGLVHVYATFAANIFAVVTAYEALNKVAQVNVLERTADLMSGKLGVSMKNLGKDIQQVTGYAVTMGEALQFGAMGTSAGLTGKQITNLVQIAKGAAAALGRDVADSTRRIIQGTAKQEQEILDELGIFVKSKQAFAEYAAARNMKADDLSATQRVNAYAEAVAKAGEKWKEYSTIEDPFAKFTSTIKQSSIELLSLVNTVFTPIISFLARSEGLVKAILLAITAQLGRMALPHLGEQLKSVFTTSPETLKAFEEAKLKVAEEYSTKIEALEAKRDAIRKARISVQPKDLDQRSLNSVNAANAAVQTTIIRNIKTQSDLEEAKSAKLITQKSTLSKITVMQGHSLNVSKQIVAAKAAELAISESIADLEAAKIAKMDEAHVSGKPKWYSLDRGASVDNRALVAARYSSITQDIGTTAIPLVEKLTNTMSNLGEMVTGATGKFGKAMNTIRMLGVVGALALQGIMAAMPYLMAAFAAWELVFSPLFYKFGIFSKEADALAESSARLNDQIKASTKGWENSKTALDGYVESSKQLDNVYATQAQSAVAMLDVIVAQEEAYINLAKAKGASVDIKGFFSGMTGTETAAGGIRDALAAALESGGLEKTSEAANKIWSAYAKMDTALKDHNLTQASFLEYTNLTKEALASMNTELEANRKALQDIVSPAEAAGKAIEELKKLQRETLDPNLPGLKTTQGQSGYKNFIESSFALSKEINANRVSAGSTSLIEQFTQGSEGLKSAADLVNRYTAAIINMTNASQSKDTKSRDKFKSAADRIAYEMLLLQEQKVPDKGRGLGAGSKVDYSTEAARAEEAALRERVRAKPSMEGISDVYRADIITSQKEYFDREREILKIKNRKEALRQKEFSDQIFLDKERQAADQKKRSEDAYILSLAEKQVSTAEASLALSEGYVDSRAASVKLMEDELALLKLKTELSESERKKAEEDIARRKRERDIAQIGKASVTEIVSGKVGFASGFQTILEDDIKKASDAARGPIKGTFDAFDAGVSSSMNTMFDTIQQGGKVTGESVATSFRNAASDIFKQLAVEQAQLAVKKTVSGVMSLFGVTGSANGNIMTDNGPLPLNKYANGGIANQAQVSIFGEGRTPEAYVPLPDGRSIPVTMKSPSNGGTNVVNSGKTDININIDQSGQASSSTSSTQGQPNTAAFAQLISRMVQKEMTTQKAPGGLLYTGVRQ